MTTTQRLLLALVLGLAVQVQAVSSINNLVPRSNCSGDTPPTYTYCVVDSDCPGGQNCLHQTMFSADVRQNFQAAYNEITDLQAQKVTGPASATDNAIVRFDGTGGKFVQSSPCTISDAGAYSCSVNSSSAPLAITQTGSGQIMSAFNNSGNGFDVLRTGVPRFNFADSSGASFTQQSFGPLMTLVDSDADDAVVFQQDGQIDTISGLQVSSKNYQVDGSGTFGFAFDRTFTPDSNGDELGDWYTALKSDFIYFDLKNSDVVNGATTSSGATFRALSLNAHMQATGATPRTLNSTGRYLMIDSVQDIENTVTSNNGQIYNIVNEIRFQGPFSSAGSTPVTHLVMHPMGMTTTGSSRTSGSATFVGVGYYGNDASSSGPLRMLASTDYISGFFMAPVEGPSGTAISSNVQVAPIMVPCKTGDDTPTCKGRSWHGPSMTIGAGGINYADPITAITGMAGGSISGEYDAVLNVYAGNSSTAVTTAMITAHVYDTRSSSTADIEKTLLKLETGGSMSGTGTAAAVGLDVIVKNNTKNIATRYATTGGGAFQHVMSSLSLTCASGSTCTSSGAIPDGAMVRSVRIRVNTAVTGCTTIKIGDGTTTDLWGAAIPVTLATTTTSADYTAASAVGLRTSATDIVVTCNGGTFSAGVIGITLDYDIDTARTA